ETVFIPVLENTGARSYRIQAITEILRHHRSKRIDIVRSDRFTQAPNESLEIDLRTLVLHFLIGFLFCGLLGIMLVEKTTTGQGQRKDAEERQESFHRCSSFVSTVCHV